MVYHINCSIPLLLTIFLSFTLGLCTIKRHPAPIVISMMCLLLYVYIIINLNMFTNCSVYPDSANHYLINDSELAVDGPLKEMFLVQVSAS